MKTTNFSQLSRNQILNNYWGFEIEISKIAAKYRLPEDELIENKSIMSTEDIIRMGFFLWERVNCLQRLHKAEKSNIIRFPRQFSSKSPYP